MRAGLIASAAASILLGSCAPAEREAAETQASADESSVEAAREFIVDAEERLAENWEYASRVFWIQENFINYDTNWLVSRVGAESTRLSVELANGTKRFEPLELPDELGRKMDILRTGITLPAPSTDGAAEELSEITTMLESTYSTGTYVHDGVETDLTELEEIMGSSRDPQELADVWAGWRRVSQPMAEPYARMVDIANEGAGELGFDNLADMWLSTYGMSPAEMESEVERLWGQVEPLYDELHCHVRAKLNEHYGDDVQPLDEPIRADLLGNMWAQQWSNISDIVTPEDGSGGSIDLTAALKEQDYTPVEMVETGEAFFTSLGLEPLPQTFWERSLFTQPRDRDVVCHASAWDVDAEDDLRIKMCAQVNEEDFRTIHHELGHNFYQRAYSERDFLFREGAHDGFHEAIGDFVALSITPDYLNRIGLLEEVPDTSADLGLLMRRALDKVAFLPFALMLDRWRWGVLRGEIEPGEYNESWWRLREQYQGIEPPVARPDDAFDPGAKYHIPANVPYLRYFLSFIMQFQFHAAACDMAGWEGPLHRCSIYGNEEVGRRFLEMMQMGASRPWPEALEAFTGTRRMDGAAIREYFAPLTEWLAEQNEPRTCGW